MCGTLGVEMILQVYHSSFVDVEDISKACGCPLLPLKSHIKGPAPVSEQDSTDIVDEAITFFRANVFFRNFDIKSPADKLLIYLTFYINLALKRLEGCRTLAEGTKAIINLGLEKVPVPGEHGFPFPGLFSQPQSEEEAGLRPALQKLLEADTRRNKWKIIECGVSIQWNSKQMVVGIFQKEVHECHHTMNRGNYSTADSTSNNPCVSRWSYMASNAAVTAAPASAMQPSSLAPHHFCGPTMMA
ncbi:hypothetical protein SASPL_125716 [Salvia splendens]|uniref:Actin-related protein 2/3 complex subunit 3 n=1 Tax=Salvia splendens TaxID=180675 RepID=A0A8X8XI48_SALSN|nr:hypothetical protein SASPL_125716 [Salvia splendens]